MWRGYSVSTSECSPGIKWSSFVKKCALARALSLGTFMLSAYLDFIDIANFIFLVGRAGATGATGTARKSGDVCNGWSTVEWYFLEQTAGKSAHKCSQRKSFQIGMCSNYRKREKERERWREKEANWSRMYSLQGAFVLFNISGCSLSTETIATFDFCIFYPQISQRTVCIVPLGEACIIYFAG